MRLLVHVEGQTEETFVNEVLGPHLYDVGYTNVGARLIGSAERRGRRGGSRSWLSVRQGIVRHLSSDRDAVSTTMVDYYGMPQGESTQWPGRKDAISRPFAEKAATVQAALAADVWGSMGNTFNQDRFIPYVSMHEFEALLFSDCDVFAMSIRAPEAAAELKAVLALFGDPEQINDSKDSKPSERIRGAIAHYDKVVFGPMAIQEIGLDVVRRQCRNFGCWLTRLEEIVR